MQHHASLPAQWPSHPATLTRLTNATASWLQRLMARRMQRATARALAQLSDRTLKDIGVDRSEIESIARSASGDRWPSR